MGERRTSSRRDEDPISETHIVLEDLTDGTVLCHVSSWGGGAMSIDIADLIRGNIG
jgi:hypothetical protein